MNNSSKRYYAIIPAAGRSTRMGQNKLLLPWPAVLPIEAETTSKRIGTVLDAVLSAWEESLVDEIVIVLRKPNGEEEVGLRDRLLSVCSKYRAQTCFAENPPDMKASISAGIQVLGGRFGVGANDCCFISPADVPGIKAEVINRLIGHKDLMKKILIPKFGSTRGHPALFPWSILSRIDSVAADKGINSLVSGENSKYVPMREELYFSDIDTIEEYEKTIGRSDPQNTVD